MGNELNGKSFFTRNVINTPMRMVFTSTDANVPNEEFTNVIIPNITTASNRYFAMSDRG